MAQNPGGVCGPPAIPRNDPSHVEGTGRPKIDVEVASTHVGMAWNAEVYRVIAERLPRPTKHA